jgi:hypothetical protein
MACPVTCTYGGQTYAVGATFADLDGCNSCVCDGSGEAACTDMACPVTCTFEGVSYAVGEAFVDGCLSCLCEATGELTCTTAPSCAGGCVYGTTPYAVGQSWVDGCIACSCGDGGVTTCDQSACPTECFGSGCDGDLICVTEPCEMCGMLPPGWCVAAPPQGLCWLDSDCSPTQDQEFVCVGAVLSSGTLGQCAAAPAPSYCWVDGHCPDGAGCVGAALCPPDADCDGPDVQGRCEMPAGQETVLLWTAKTYYFPGATAHPIWFNFTAESIWLPGCTTYTVEEKQGATWIDLGPPAVCGWEGYALEVKPGDAWEALQTALPGDVMGFKELRLRGTYALGCDATLPLSDANCASVHEALRLLSVGPPPP